MEGSRKRSEGAARNTPLTGHIDGCGWETGAAPGPWVFGKHDQEHLHQNGRHVGDRESLKTGIAYFTISPLILFDHELLTTFG